MSLREWWSEQSTGVKVALILFGIVAVGMLLIAMVIGAAVVGTFVLDVGDSEQRPAADFTHEYSSADGTVQISLVSGDSLHAGSVYVAVNGERQAAEWGADEGMIAPGDSTVVSGVAAGDLVTVQYEGSDMVYAIEEWTVE